jgi:N-formylglutamate deformylase
MTISPPQDHHEVSRSFGVIPGDPRSSVIIHVPHSSRLIPDAVREGIYLDDAALERELDVMTDAWTDVIAAHVAARAPVRPWLFVNGHSRLVVDPERDPHGKEKVKETGLGVVYTGTSDGFVLRDPSDDEVSGLLDRYFAPYVEALAALVDQRVAATGEVVVVDLHSYPLQAVPCEPDSTAPRPEIGLGTDQRHTPPELVEAARAAFAPFLIGQDAPYRGCYVPPAPHGRHDNVQALGVELRRDLYVDENYTFVEPAIEPIVASLSDLVASIEQRAAERV